MPSLSLIPYWEGAGRMILLPELMRFGSTAWGFFSCITWVSALSDRLNSSSIGFLGASVLFTVFGIGSVIGAGGLSMYFGLSFGIPGVCLIATDRSSGRPAWVFACDSILAEVETGAFGLSLGVAGV